MKHPALLIDLATMKWDPKKRFEVCICKARAKWMKNRRKKEVAEYC